MITLLARLKLKNNTVKYQYQPNFSVVNNTKFYEHNSIQFLINSKLTY